MFNDTRPDPEELSCLLGEFIGFESVAQNNKEKAHCIDWLQSAFLSNAPVRPQKGEVTGCPYLHVHCEDQKLLWFGHIDVVPAAPEMFTLRTSGDRVFGRGVKDMKGACLPFLMAYRDARNEGENPPVSVLLTSDEETAGHTIPTLLREHGLTAPVAFTPDTGSSPGIVVEHKAVLWAELSVTGVSTHGAMPWSGTNPIWIVTEALQTLRKRFPDGSPDDWQMTLSPTSIHGGETRNQTPASILCNLDIRYPQELFSSAEEIVESFQRMLPAGSSLRILAAESGLKCDPDLPMVTLVRTIAEEVEGKEIPFIREDGSTDARYFQAAGIPAFLYGPEGGNLHGPEEWVSVSSLKRQYLFYRELFQKL